MPASHFEKYDGLLNESSRDPKLAMRDCERKLKRSPQDPAFNLFKAHLLVKLRSYEQAHLQCVELAKNPRVAEDSDVVAELLRLEHKTSQALARGGEVEVIKALEKHKECLQNAFGALVSYGYWEAAESAVIALQRLRPKDHQRQHLRFLMSKLYASSCRLSDPTTSTMRDRLLKAMLKKAVDNSALSSTQDLRFFLQLHVQMQDWAAAVELLNNDKLGLFSPLGKADIEFIRIKLECLAKLQRWQDVHDFCVLVISAGAEREEPVAELRQWRLDALVWQHLTDALVELRRDDGDFDFENFATGLVPDVDLDSSSSRIVWVSRMRFASRSSGRTQDATSDALSKVCLAYLEEHHSKFYCYEDLKDFIQLTSQAQSEHLLRQARHLTLRLEDNNKRRTVAELNYLKLRFLISLSKESPSALSSITEFVTDIVQFIIRLRSVDERDASILENAFLLAVSGVEKAMVLASSKSERSVLLLQAAALLESALLGSNAPTSYRVRLLLMTYYRQMGCTSIAMQHYQVLRVREIQNDTVTHLLYHRISILHAFAIDNAEHKRHSLDMPISNPTLALQRIVDWYDEAGDRTNAFISARVDDIRFDKVQEFLDLKDRLRRSQWRQLATLERRRIARLADRAYDDTDQKIDLLNSTWATDLSDNRDFNCATAYWVKGDSEWRPSDAADAQSALYYTAVLTELDATHSLLTVKDPVAEHQNGLIRLSRVSEALQGAEPSPSPFSEGEMKAYAIIQKMRPLVIATVLGDRPELAKLITIPSEKDIAATLVESLSFIASLEPLSSDPDKLQWSLLSDVSVSTVVSQLECLKILVKLADHLATASKQKTHPLFKKVRPEVLTQIKKDALTKGDVLQNSAQDWRRHIKADWEALLDPVAARHAHGAAQGGMAAEVVKLVGREWVKSSLAPMLRESMMETLGGISRIKIG